VRRNLPLRAMTGLLSGFLLAAACGGGSDTAATTGRSSTDRAKGDLRLDQVQVLGSHNSYHRFLFDAPRQALEQSLPALAEQLDYEHPPLPEQFDLGVRQIELDIVDDPRGGKYAAPTTGDYPNLPRDPVMRTPGFKVIHFPGLDTNSSCLTLVQCLRLVGDWSAAHPGHVPIAVYLENKDGTFDADRLARLEAEIRAAIPREQLLTPDDVRGDAATVGDAVRERGWPAVDGIRGRIWLFVPGAAFRDVALTRYPGLRGALVFTGAEPGAPDAAVALVDDPVADGPAISAAVREHMMVRTRTDADTREARTGDTAKRDTALASGAQLVSTDYERPDPRFGTGYVVRIPGGTPGRCNPVTAPPGCRPRDVEDPARLTRRAG